MIDLDGKEELAQLLNLLSAPPSALVKNRTFCRDLLVQKGRITIQDSQSVVAPTFGFTKEMSGLDACKYKVKDDPPG